MVQIDRKLGKITKPPGSNSKRAKRLRNVLDRVRKVREPGRLGDRINHKPPSLKL